MLVCDGAAMPANPGVNPALTITALAEYAMQQVPETALSFYGRRLYELMSAYWPTADKPSRTPPLCP